MKTESVRSRHRSRGAGRAFQPPKFIEPTLETISFDWSREQLRISAEFSDHGRVSGCVESLNLDLLDQARGMPRSEFLRIFGFVR